jgi:hypothetical protein
LVTFGHFFREKIFAMASRIAVFYNWRCRLPFNHFDKNKNTRLALILRRKFSNFPHVIGGNVFAKSSQLASLQDCCSIFYKTIEVAGCRSKIRTPDWR